MRRQLFLAALFLVAVVALRLWSGGAEGIPPGYCSTGQLEAYEELLITGQVYQKDETSIYLKSVIRLEPDAFGQSATSQWQKDQHQKEKDQGQKNQFQGNQSQKDGYREVPFQENFICETEKASEIPLGRTVALRGTFYPYSHATNPGEFDAADYYRTLEIGGKLRKTEILALGEDWWPLRNGLYELKCLLKGRLYRIFPEKEAAVMSALLLGDKKDLDSELKDLYKRNGILHILSISSLHITIIGMSVYKLLRRLGLPVCPAAVGGGILLLLYGGMTGFGVSACRAIGMYLIRMLGEVVGRTYDMLTALGVMGAVMAAGNPFYLQNSGFLLSFSSVLGLGLVSPALMPELAGGAGRRGKDKGDFRERASVWLRKMGASLLQSLLASLSITLMTLPIQLWFYYEIPVYSVFLNLFVLPLMKPMMITGLLAMLVPGLGVLGTVDYVILKSYEFLCGCFDGLPFHTWNPGCPRVWQVVAYYLLLAGAVAMRRWAKKQAEEGQGIAQNLAGEKAGVRRGDFGKGVAGLRPVHGLLGGISGFRRVEVLMSVLGIFALPCAVLLFAVHPPAVNSVSLLDVGQGDCILVRLSSGENYLFDCGSSSRSGVGRYVLIPYLKYYGIRNIDALFLSHPDADHVNGAVELLEAGGESRITVGQLLLPAIPAGERQEQFGELLAAAQNASQADPVPVGYLGKGESFRRGSADFTCLHPNGSINAEDINACSQCFYVEFRESGGAGGWTLLLTGDVQNEGEEALQETLRERGIGGLSVLKVAHHGSKNSTPKELLEQLSPRLTLISSGRRNRYGHPHAELLDRLEACGTAVVQTAQSGAVTVTYGGGGLLVSAFAQDASVE